MNTSNKRGRRRRSDAKTAKFKEEDYNVDTKKAKRNTQKKAEGHLLAESSAKPPTNANRRGKQKGNMNEHNRRTTKQFNKMNMLSGEPPIKKKICEIKKPPRKKAPPPNQNQTEHESHSSDQLLQLGNEVAKTTLKSDTSLLDNKVSLESASIPVECTSSQTPSLSDDSNRSLVSKKTMSAGVCNTKKSSDSSESEWEDVDDGEQECDLDNYNPEIPKQGVEITIEPPVDWRKKRRIKHQFDYATFLRRHINRFKKDIQIDVHKVHLLCFIAHGIKLNEILNSEFLKGVALSVIPSDILMLSSKKLNVEIISKILDWYCNTFSSTEIYDYQLSSLSDRIIHGFEEGKAHTISDFTFMFLLIINTLGFDVRLCVSLYPVSFKPTDLIPPKKPKQIDNATEIGQEEMDKKSAVTGSKISSNSIEEKLKENTSVCEVILDGNDNKGSSTSKGDPSNPSASLQSNEGTDHDITIIHEGKSSKSNTDGKKVQRLRRNISKKGNNSSGKKLDEGSPKRASSPELYTISDESFSESDEDFVVSYKSKRRKRKMVKSKGRQVSSDTSTSSQRKAKKQNRKILSSDSEDDIVTAEATKKGIEHWLEIYSPMEKKWICIECIHKIINEPYEIEAKATQPVSYVLAFRKKFIKDVTRRYSSKWMTDIRKVRIDPDWWEETLIPFTSKSDTKDREEEKQLDMMLLNKPMPVKVSEYKNHPLYALKRHLLKFEAIYPPDAPSLGFVRGEPVYARECVQILHSRENWMKEARVVRLNEQPYKVVKGRRKWNKFLREFQEEQSLDLFGKWQTEDYIPPIAQDGKVPRNEYGNVELFQPCMLPQGTVHLQFPALNRVAKKLGIDCVPALVGFDGHGGGVHPVFDGWIVCKEFEEVLLAAWQEEQRNIRQREQEKREKRVYGNWRRLIRGLLIRERLKAAYDSQE